ncbi:hypothetical protein KM043_009894 [Ampulex compressa]|nr:hypothetical protein KM043_009894 [Ampulex compressa]
MAKKKCEAPDKFQLRDNNIIRPKAAPRKSAWRIAETPWKRRPGALRSRASQCWLEGGPENLCTEGNFASEERQIRYGTQVRVGTPRAPPPAAPTKTTTRTTTTTTKRRTTTPTTTTTTTTTTSKEDDEDEEEEDHDVRRLKQGDRPKAACRGISKSRYPQTHARSIRDLFEEHKPSRSIQISKRNSSGGTRMEERNSPVFTTSEDESKSRQGATEGPSGAEERRSGSGSKRRLTARVCGTMSAAGLSRARAVKPDRGGRKGEGKEEYTPVAATVLVP